MRFRIGPTARRRLFGLAAAVSLLLFHGVCVLWAFDLKHETIDAAQWSYDSPPHEGEYRSWSVRASSYSGTLRVDVGEVRYGPAYFVGLPLYKRTYFDKLRPTGGQWHVWGGLDTAAWEHHPPGFDAEHRVWSIKPGHRVERWALAVRTWFAAALLSVLPAVWFYRRLKARRPRAAE